MVSTNSRRICFLEGPDGVQLEIIQTKGQSVFLMCRGTLIMQELSPTLQTFCEQEDLLRLAYVDRQGYPHVVPVWFVLLDGAYYVGTGATSAKWKAMQRDARVGWVIDGGTRNHYKGVSMCGQATEVSETAERARVYEALGRKYFGALDQARFIEIFGRVDDPESVYLKLIPEDGLTWEY
jgi:nitroimidazol reductase NimA-like FMN-containing flavoprotein (pyridoxamine 5'-phosphate oxidase superfamily)